MEVLLSKSQYDLLIERFVQTDSFAAFIREQLKSIYEPLRLYGKLPNPDDDCDTNEGVLGVYPHSKEDKWSVLNRFDTNVNVKKRMKELCSFELNNENPTDIEFRDWISKNKKDLMGPGGKYTQELVDLNKKTIEKGAKGESYAVTVLKDKFPNATRVRRFCSGDVRDTRKGIDIAIDFGDKTVTVQVKPFIHIKYLMEDDGDSYYEVKSYFEPNKYSDRNVNIFMFVNENQTEFIMFNNYKSKIGQMRNNITRFYEPPLYTNMNLTLDKKRTRRVKLDVYSIFDSQKQTLQDLYDKRAKIDSLIQKLEKLKFSEDQNAKKSGKV